MHCYFDFLSWKEVYLCCRSVCSAGINSCVLALHVPQHERLWIVNSAYPDTRTETETETVIQKLLESQVQPLVNTVISAPPFSCTSFLRLHARGENRTGGGWCHRYSEVLKKRKKKKSCSLSSLVPSFPYLQAPPPVFSHVTEGAQHPQERLWADWETISELTFGFSPIKQGSETQT